MNSYLLTYRKENEDGSFCTVTEVQRFSFVPQLREEKDGRYSTTFAMNFNILPEGFASAISLLTRDERQS